MKHSSKVLLLVAGLVLMAGCGGEEKESYSRYPSVRIPQFTGDDYIAQLSSEEPEVVYNAVCNLGNQARGMGSALWGKGADPEKENWKKAQSVYTHICAQLQSEVPMTVAASLRFLQLFAETHEARSELVEPVCQVKSSLPVVQFEQVALLKILVDETSQIPEPLLRRLLDSKSWIVSRSTYGLIGKLSNESLRSELLTRYRSASDEADRLLLLEAYGNRSEPEVIEFIMQEMLATENTRIRSIAFGSLLNQIETPLVQAWMIEHSAELRHEERERLFDIASELDDADVGFDLMRQMLVSGYVPDDDFLEEYLEMEHLLMAVFSDKVSEELSEDIVEELDLTKEEIEECRVIYARMEKILQESPEAAARLNELREKEVQKRIRREALAVEFYPLVEEFVKKAQVVLTEQGVSPDKQQEFLQPVTGLNMENIIPAISP